MSKLERSLIQPWLQKHLPGEIIPVENPLKTGFPDLIYTIAGVTGLIELKYRKKPPSRGPTNFLLEDHQALFAAQWTEAGGICFLIVRIESTNEWLVVHGSKLLSKGKAVKIYMSQWSSIASYHSLGYPNVNELTRVLTCSSSLLTTKS